MEKCGAKGNSKFCDICDAIPHLLFIVEFSEESEIKDKGEIKYNHVFELQKNL